MFVLENSFIRYSVDEDGNVTSIYNKRTSHEYVKLKGDLFRLIYSIDDFEERSINSNEQKPYGIMVDNNEMTVHYNGLNSKNGLLDIQLIIKISLKNEQITVVSYIKNNSDAELKELQTTAFSGIYSLGDNPENDTIIVPRTLGQKIFNPTEANFYDYVNVSGRKYERPDHIHTDINIPYPGYCSMKWFSMYNNDESIYVADHGEVSRIICMHIEKRNAEKTLNLGICQYLFLKKGESITTQPVIYALLKGDWHSCAKYYRKWISNTLNWKPSLKPNWIKEFQGWLRVIFRTQSGEFNFHFKDIPKMFDEVQDAGLNTLFILGWPNGGFGRMRPDYFVNPNHIDDLNINYSFIYNLRFDLSIARCCATPVSIPNYCKYMKEILAIRNKYRDYLIDGKFADVDGFETNGNSFRAKSYISKDGRLGVAIWNCSDSTATQVYINKSTGKSTSVTLDKDCVCFVEL
ncbi:MAG: hypothetical protein E7396_01370 [Ruminococcaceae bacterium]|nr:hypothetical protein [Oscillospiraceae bacterium]